MSTAYLIEKIQAIETRAYSDPVSSLGRQAFSVPTGWEAVDSSLHVASEGSYLPGLACGVVHEWFGVLPSKEAQGNGDQRQNQSRNQARGWAWSPPLTVLSHLALRACTLAPASFVVWIGRRCWPSLWHLAFRPCVKSDQGIEPSGHQVQAQHRSADSSPRSLDPSVARWLLRHGRHDGHDAFAQSGVNMLDRSVFVDPANRAARLWAIDLSMRCSAVCAVVADGTSFDLAATRRLQVAAANRRALVLLTRPPREMKQLSAAATRWRVCCAASPTRSPRFNLELLRCKMPQQLRGGLTHGQSWLVESSHETGCRGVPAVLANRSASAASTTAATATATAIQPTIQSIAL